MAKKNLLIAAFVVASLAAFLVFLFAKQMSDEKAELIGKQVEVVKAAREIPVGTPLKDEMVKSELVPEKFLPPNYILKDDITVFYGQPLAVKIQKDKMILTSDFAVSQVSRDLSSKIPAGERALSIPVNTISGVSSLLRPGDRVDILGTFPVTSKDEVIEEAEGAQSVGYVTMTLLQNVTLLAVGQQFSDVASDQQQRQQYSAVTMSVTVDEAELLTIAQTRGKLMLLLRNRDDIEVTQVSKRTLKQVLKDLEILQDTRNKKIIKPPKRRPPVKKGPSIKIINGAGR